MKRNVLLLGLALSATSMYAQPAAGNIGNILEYQSDCSFALELVGESGVRGCVGDFNNDGIDDFIITGLHKIGEKDGVDGDGKPIKINDMRSFLHVYLGQNADVPKLIYSDDEFVVGGNGSIDCAKNTDGSWLIAVQGGATGNWSNPFTAYMYNLSINGNDATFEQLIDLDRATGRGSIRLLDMDMDGNLDAFQHGWLMSGSWDATSNIYLNIDNTNTMFDMDTENHGIRPANNTFAVKGDINGDGKVDILLPIQGLGLFAYMNNGDGTFTEETVTLFAVKDREDGINIRNEEDGSQADLIDLDGDGKPEVILAGTVDNTGGDWKFIVKIYKYADGAFTEITPKNKNGEAIEWLGGQRGDFAIGDFDGDGKQDFILSAENQNTEKVWGCRTYFFSGNGNGGFDQFECTMTEGNTHEGIAPMSRRAQFGQFLVGDFNGDGKPDLVQAGTTYYAKLGAIRYYGNISTGSSSIGNTKTNDILISAIGKELHVKGALNAKVTITDLSGAVCAIMDVDTDNAILPLNLNTGIYIVGVTSDSGVATQKIAVK